jgi:hypothetical protein
MARERERWPALWLVARGWSAAEAAKRWSGTRTISASGSRPSGGPAGLPGASPGFNANAAIWGGVREEVTAKTYFRTATLDREHFGQFFRDLTGRAEVKRRCRSVLQAGTEVLARVAAALPHDSQDANLTLALA